MFDENRYIDNRRQPFQLGDKVYVLKLPHHGRVSGAEGISGCLSGGSSDDELRFIFHTDDKS